MRSVRPRKTVDDYMRLPEEARVELIDGEFYPMPSGVKTHLADGARLEIFEGRPYPCPPNSPAHQTAVVNTSGLLNAHAKARASGRVFVAPLDCVLSDQDVVQPDVLFVTANHLERLQHCLFGPPDLAVEVLALEDAIRDRILKRNLYAKYGVPEFWIVDPDAKTVEVMRLESGAFRLLGMFEGGEEIVSPTFQGLSLRVDHIFE